MFIETEAEMVGLAITDLCRLARWRQITITDMATAGVRVRVEGGTVGHRHLPPASVDVTESTLLESLNKAVKELRGF